MNSIFIFRRDLRIKDNIGFINCFNKSKNVYPIFIFTYEQIKNNDFKSSNAVQFMVESLKDLDKELKKYDSKLHLFYGKIDTIISYLIKEKNINAVFTNTDYTPYAIKRDNDLKNYVKKIKLNLIFLMIILFEPGTIKTGSVPLTKIWQKFCSS